MADKKISRYNSNSDAKVNDTVLFDNAGNFQKKLPSGLISGVVTGLYDENEVMVNFKLRTGEQVELPIHYLLLK